MSQTYLLEMPAGAWLDGLVQMLDQTRAPVWIIGSARSGKSLLAEALIAACGVQGFKPEVFESSDLPHAVPNAVYLVVLRQVHIDVACALSDVFDGAATPDELLNMRRWQACFRAGTALDGTKGGGVAIQM